MSCAAALATFPDRRLHPGSLRGGFEETPRAYAPMIRRYARSGLIAAASQDCMCEPAALKATGLTMAWRGASR
jgi:hypothetical protein